MSQFYQVSTWHFCWKHCSYTCITLMVQGTPCFLLIWMTEYTLCNVKLRYSFLLHSLSHQFSQLANSQQGEDFNRLSTRLSTRVLLRQCLNRLLQLCVQDFRPWVVCVISFPGYLVGPCMTGVPAMTSSLYASSIFQLLPGAHSHCTTVEFFRDTTPFCLCMDKCIPTFGGTTSA